MPPPISPAIVVRLSQVFAAVHPEEEDEAVIRRANNLIASLRSMGLDVVFSTWVDGGPAYGNKQEFDPFIEGMRLTLERLGDRTPWRGPEN